MGEVWSALATLDTLQTELRDFGHAIEAALALSFGYSILLNFGKFSGQTISRWIRRERVRVMAAMAETKTFNEEELNSGFDKVKRTWPWWIRFTNRIAVTWAVASISCSVALLIILGLVPTLHVRGFTALVVAIFLFGPVPVGLLACLILHGCARLHMRRKTNNYNDTIALVTGAPRSTLKKSRETLAKRKREKPRSAKTSQTDSPEEQEPASAPPDPNKD